MCTEKEKLDKALESFERHISKMSQYEIDELLSKYNEEIYGTLKVSDLDNLKRDNKD